MRQLVALGAVAMLAQVALLRECAVMSSGIELLVVAALGIWLLGTAAGAASGRARAARPPGRAGFVLAGLLVPLAVVTARGIRGALGGVPGGYLPLERQALALAAVLVPSSFVLGLLFQRTAAVAIDARRTLARAYAAECVGGLAGGLLATLLPVAGVSNLAAALGAGAVALAVAAAPPRRGARVGAPAAVLLALTLVALAASGALDRRLTAWSHPRLLATRDTPYARVTVTGTLGQVAVFEDDALAYESQGTAAEEFVGLAALQGAPPRDVLVLGGAVGGLLPEVLRLDPARVDDVEMDGALLAEVTPVLPAAARAALADPRVHVRIADPRRALAGGGRWDLILIGLPEPQSGRTNRVYTRECFRDAARHLRPGGVLALRLAGAENLWTPALLRRTASVERALRAAFRSTLVLPGTTDVLLASATPLESDPATLAARARERLPGARRVTPAYVRYLVTNDRFAEFAAALARTRAPLDTDARPACYPAAMVLWLSRFAPRLAQVALPETDARALLRAPAAWAGATLVAGVLLVARRRPRARRVLLAALSGCAGMGLESVVLLHHQTHGGALYRDLGVLLMAFMAGLALGAPLLERVLRATPRTAAPRAATAGVLGLLAALGLGTALLVRAGLAGGLAGAAALQSVGGALVAATFACAARADAAEERVLAGPLYAADVLGGAVGSLAAALAAIPLLGLAATAGLAAAVAVAAVLLA